MSLGDYKYRVPSAKPDPAEEVKRTGAEVIAQVHAWRVDAEVRAQQLRATSLAAEHLMTQARAHIEVQQQQRQLLDQGWDNTVAVLERIEAARAEIDERLAAAHAAAEMSVRFPGAAFPGEFPGAIAALGPLYPGGADPVGRLYGLLTTAQAGVDAALPLAGGAMSGTLSFTTDSPLSLNGYYTISTSNLGAPGHEATGPRFHINNVPDGRTPFVINSLGQSIVTIQDESLDDLTVSHGLQIRRRPTVLATSGIGSGIQFFCADTSSLSADTEVGNVQFLVTAVTPGAMTSVLRFRALTAGSNRQVCQMWGDGKIEAVNTTEGGHFQVAASVFVGTAAHGAFSVGNVAFDGSGAAFTGLSGGTGFAANFGAGFTGRFLDLQLAGVSLVRVGATGQTVLTVSDTSNASPASPLVLDHVLSSGTPAVGFGSQFAMNVRDTANSSVTGGQFQCVTTVATPGGVTSNLTFQHRKAGSVTTAFYIDDSSNINSGFKGIFTGGVGVGNSTAATTLTAPGTITKKIPILDTAGNVLAYVAGYATGSFS